ncbi:hypothetical protein FHS76_001828 [Ochrobactrum daejeonense]|uniref:GguC protein n=1 Tax=Brucella daejeonensis TaxID=659015 RepID=A0A7W9EL25_9HYPH|nr:AraD1 family protein [Brucella daejeonensis]MBB5701953.1 hypothetical protein [Brucella daejeonensis]NKB80091.1 GguC protein [Brucella daejeonensis]
MLISQIRGEDGAIRVLARAEGEPAREVLGATGVRELALAAIKSGKPLIDYIKEQGFGAQYDAEQLAAEGCYLSPITHMDPTHLHLTGTGLTHLGSAATRDSMHAKAMAAEAELTDSMKMFRMGLEGGKPAAGEAGVQPEWFYKGNGHGLATPGAALVSPAFAQDFGEEPEIAGIYVIADDGRPLRIGFAVANEFSDHVTERGNYLWLAHSKLRPASIGPEIRIGAAPQDIRGTSRILRDGKVIWEKPFLSGEANMSHTIANLEYHHFKYGLFRQPGDVHVHMFGTATLSFADGVRTQPGDVFEIVAEGFGQPLRNTVVVEPVHALPELAAVEL